MIKLTIILILGTLGALLSGSSTLAVTDQHAEPTVRITLRDGSMRTAVLQGVGCPIAICSRVAFKGVHQDYAILSEDFKGLDAIRDVTSHAASFVAKDGRSKRLTLLHDFRVLYLEDPSGKEQKLDLREVKSVEFTGAAR